MSKIGYNIMEVLKLQAYKPCLMLDDRELVEEDAGCRKEIVRLVLSLLNRHDTATSRRASSKETPRNIHPGTVWIAYLLDRTTKRYKAIKAEIKTNRPSIINNKIIAERFSTPLILTILSPVLSALRDDVLGTIVQLLVDPNQENNPFFDVPQQVEDAVTQEIIKKFAEHLEHDVAGEFAQLVEDLQSESVVLRLTSPHSYQARCVACNQTASSGFSCCECRSLHLCDACYVEKKHHDVEHHEYGEFKIEEEITQLQLIIASLRRKKILVSCYRGHDVWCERCCDSLNTRNADFFPNPVYYYSCNDCEGIVVCSSCFTEEGSKSNHRSHTFTAVVDTDDELQADYAVQVYLTSKGFGGTKAANIGIRIYEKLLHETTSSHDQSLPGSKRNRVANKLVSVINHIMEHYMGIDAIEKAFQIHLRIADIAEQTQDTTLQMRNFAGLGETMLFRFELSKDLVDVKSAIGLLEEALGLATKFQDPMHSTILGLLAGAKLARHLHTNSIEDLDEAVHNSSKAAASSPCPIQVRMVYMKVLLAKFERSNDRNTINEAIKLGDNTTSHVLGNAYLLRFRAFGERKDLLMAIYWQQQALCFSIKYPHPFASWLTGKTTIYEVEGSLAAAHLAQYELDKKEDYLEIAINCLTSAIEETPRNSLEYPRIRGQLGEAFVHKYDLDCNHTTSKTREWRVKTPLELLGTSTSFESQFYDYHFGSEFDVATFGQGPNRAYEFQLHRPTSELVLDCPTFDLLNYAVTLHKQTLARTPKKSTYRLQRLRNLGLAYSRRYYSYNHFNKQVIEADRAEAREALNEALKLTDDNVTHPMYADLHAELGKLDIATR